MDLAIDNAHWVIDFQGGSGVERGVQDALGGVWMLLLSHIYLAAQIVVLPGVLVAMYRWAPKIYPRLRRHRDRDLDAVAADLRAVPGRAAAAGGTRDDRRRQRARRRSRSPATRPGSTTRSRPSRACTAGSRWRSGSPSPRRCSARWLQVLALSWGPIVALSTVATANHYLFDVVAGLADHGRRLRRGHVPPAARCAGPCWCPHDPRRDPRPPPRDAGRRGGDPRASAPGIVPVGAVADRHALWPLLYRTDPDVVVVDDLQLCLTVRARHPRPRVVLYAAGAAFDAIVPAAFAGARRSSTRPAARTSCWPRSAASARCRRSRRGCSGAPRSGSAAPTARSSRCAWRARRTARSRRSSGCRATSWPAGSRRSSPRWLSRRGRRARRRERAPRGMTRRPWRRCCAGASRPSSWTGRASRRSACSSGGRRPAGRSRARGP